MAKRINKTSFPSLEEIQQEMTRVKSRGRYHKALRSTVSTIVVVAALAVLVAALLLPVLRPFSPAILSLLIKPIPTSLGICAVSITTTS